MSTKRWGEQEDDEEEKVVAQPSRVQSFVSGTDKEGIKTITEYRTDENGTKIQVVRKVRETKVIARVHKDVEARRGWKKFGKCANLPPGPEPNVTYTSHENVNLQLKSKKREEEAPDDDDPLAKLKSAGESIVLCKHCGGRGHWSLKCPKRSEIAVTQKSRPNEEPETKTKPYEEPSGKYVPVHMRTKPGAAGGGGPGAPRADESANQIRVTNIPEATTENDLRDLFRPFGNTSRIYLAIDKSTNQSRGFAFITYTNRQDAQKAIDRLNGYGYGNLILHVEWAKPREETEIKAQGAGREPGWNMRGTK